MNGTMRHRLAVLGMVAVAGSALAVGGTPAVAANTASSGSAAVATDQGTLSPDRGDRRWRRVGDFDTRRECARLGERGERRGWWRDYRCMRDHDRDRGHGRSHDDDEYTLWVRWRR